MVLRGVAVLLELLLLRPWVVRLVCMALPPLASSRRRVVRGRPILVRLLDIDCRPSLVARQKPPQVVSSARMSAHRTVIVDLLNEVLGNDREVNDPWTQGGWPLHAATNGGGGGSGSGGNGGDTHDDDRKGGGGGGGGAAARAVDGAGRVSFWMEVKNVLVDKFGEEALTMEESLDGFVLRQALPNNGLIVLINRLQVMGCFSLKADAEWQLQSLPRRRAQFHAKGQQERVQRIVQSSMDCQTPQLLLRMRGGMHGFEFCGTITPSRRWATVEMTTFLPFLPARPCCCCSPRCFPFYLLFSLLRAPVLLAGSSPS
jgi:hypothetical protein